MVRATKGTRWAVLGCVLLVGATAARGYGAVIGQWNLNEGSGMTVSPEVGSITGTLTTTNVTWQPVAPPATNVGGVIVTPSTSLLFPGNTADYVDFGTSSTLAPNSITVAFWAKDTRGAVANEILLARYDHVPGSFEMGFASGVLNFRIWPQTGSEIRVGLSAANPYRQTSFLDGQWHLMVGTYDSTSGVGSLYVDGTLIQSLTVANPPQPISSQTQPMNLGRRAYNNAWEPFKGLIGGPLLIYDNALTLAEVQRLQQIPEPSAVLLAGLGGLALWAFRRRRRE